MKFELEKRKNPIMVSSELFFETKAVYNPTVIKKGSQIYMLYRAESYDDHTGCIGLAWSEDGIHFTKYPKPVLMPEYDYERIGCEDPRVVELDDTYYMSYVAVGDNVDGIQIALAKSFDLIHWEKLGPIKMKLEGWCSEKIKAPAIAPVKVNNKYILYFLGQKRGWHTAIGVAYSEDLIHWQEDVRNPVITPRYDNYDCLGVEPGATPIVIEDKIVLLYNAWDEKRIHRTWYAVFDGKDPGKLVERGEDPLLSPEQAWECKGYVPNVIFAEGIVEQENQYYVYYGAADTSIGLAVSKKEEEIKMSIRKLREKFEREREEKQEQGTLLKFEGVDGYDVYNTSVPFTYEGKEYIFGRVERRNEWATSAVCLFEKKSEDVWERVRDTMMYQLEDPFVVMVNNELVLGGTRVDYARGKLSGFCGVFYKGTNLFNLHYFTTGPQQMKDIRYVQLKDKKLGVFSRPRGEEIKKRYGSEAVIGFTVLNDIMELDAEVVEQATVIEGIFGKDEWGGCNQCLLLENGKIGIIGHGCYNEFDGKMNQLVYTNIAFVFDPETFQVSDMKMIGTRKSYPAGEGKKPNLADCVFTSGIAKRADGYYDLYSGVGDIAEGRVVIENPFPVEIVW